MELTFGRSGTRPYISARNLPTTDPLRLQTDLDCLDPHPRIRLSRQMWPYALITEAEYVNSFFSVPNQGTVGERMSYAATTHQDRI